MKALNLSSESQGLLIIQLKELFGDDFMRIELETTSHGVVVTFSNVGKNNPLNFLAGRLVNQEIPLLELFLRYIPEQLSEYGVGNRSWTPIFVQKFVLLCRSTGDNMVAYLNDLMSSIPKYNSDDYNKIKADLDKIGQVRNEETVINIIKTASGLLGDDANLAQYFITTR